jgi:DNA-binding CsgD family transcriptional regulator
MNQVWSGRAATRGGRSNYAGTGEHAAGPASTDLNELSCKELMTGEPIPVNPRLVESLPWRKINDFLVAIGAQRSLETLGAVALREIAALVPLDSGRFLVWLGTPEPGPAGLGARGNSKKVFVDLHIPPEQTRAYFEYFVTVDPTLAFYPSTHRAIVSWWRRDCEISRDLMRRHGTRHAMHIRSQEHWGGRGFTFNIRRSTGRGFTEREMAVFFALYPHLDNLVSLIRDPATARKERLVAAARACGLTPRESDVALLLCDRLSAAEIAERLKISCRTVEKHTERLYIKLGVNNRRGLREETLLRDELGGERHP